MVRVRYPADLVPALDLELAALALDLAALAPEGAELAPAARAQAGLSRNDAVGLRPPFVD